MVIHELSFRSTTPLEHLSFHSQQVDLMRAIPPGDLAKEIGSLATRLRQETGHEVLAGGWGKLLSSSPLATCDAFRVLTVDAIDLTDLNYSSSLKQVINRAVAKYFERRNLKVNAYHREAFSRTVTSISSDIEAQRYLKWDIRIDEQKYVFLSIDYSNEYRDRLTVHERGVETIPIKQQLVHTYDSTTCRFSGRADFTVSTPLESLGNISLLEFQRRKGAVPLSTLDAIPPDTRAVHVNYGSQGKNKLYPHIPQLLKKAFTRDDVDAKKFNEQVWPIDRRFREAIKAISTLNQSSGLTVQEQILSFEPQPRRPEPQINFVQLAKKKGYEQNLDFGNGILASYPSQGLNQNQLLEKPEQIQAVVFYPEGEDVKGWCRDLRHYCDRFGIRLDVPEFRPYPLGNVLGIQRECRHLQGADLAFMCVPDQGNYRNSPTADPYPVLKREFVQAMLPSQGIELSTVRERSRGSLDNVMLGVLGKLGYSPWKLRYMPGRAQAFLGLDVGRKDGRAVGAAAFVVNQLGRVIGWSATDFQAHRETFDATVLRRIVFGLVNLFEQQEQTELTHLVIHRDGLAQDGELELLDALTPELREAGVQAMDVVEIVKSGYDRAGAFNPATNRWDNPKRGWSWSNTEDEAMLMTTGAREIKGGSNFVPRPITVRRRRGSTRIGTLAAQAYWLSEMHVGSTQTVRLPITTYYADAAAEYALEGLLSTGVQMARGLPFL